MATKDGAQYPAPAKPTQKAPKKAKTEEPTVTEEGGDNASDS
jgi:hypothetical protein